MLLGVIRVISQSKRDSGEGEKGNERIRTTEGIINNF